jgi:hypothetical protein
MHHDALPVLVLAPNDHMCSGLRSVLEDDGDIVEVEPISSCSWRRREREVSNSFSGVIVDVSQMISKNKMEAIYDYFATECVRDDDFFFVLLE